MIECVFTLDYETYGNGAGSLEDLVYGPAERLRSIFKDHGARFVAFVEAAELEKIEECGADPAIDRVRRQVHELCLEGFEIGLHLHPQWSNARFERGRWLLDYGEYNLCTLPEERIRAIVTRSLEYLRYATGQQGFTPISFRAGNWLFQPTGSAAAVLAEQGIALDSSVFKGGYQHRHGLDYRSAVENGYCWRFSSDVNVEDPNGPLLELPIYTELIPCWKMLTTKRLGFKNNLGSAGPGASPKLSRLRDLLRFRYPLKLDFCRMTLHELTSMLSRVISEDTADPEAYRPIVAIGHTKDFRETDTVGAFLSFLQARGVGVCTLAAAWQRLAEQQPRLA